ncbi:MAG: ATP-grasp domain-containing protein [bacterium]
MAKNIGIWMYQNSGGDIIEQQLVSGLRDHGYNVFTGLNLAHADINHQGIYCRSRSGVNVRMDTLDLFFTYNAGEQTLNQVYLYKVLDRYIPILNSYASFALTEDKFRTNLMLRKNNVATPDFQLIPATQPEKLHAVFHEWGGQLVSKPLDGWGGIGVTKVESENTLKSLIAYAKKKNTQWFYVERLIDYDKTDFRVDIVNGEYLGCYGRKAPKGEWKTNVSGGGSVFLRNPEPAVIDLAKRATAATGLDIAGVDIIYDRAADTYRVLEVNGIPAFATPEQEKLGLTFNARKVELIIELIVTRVNQHSATKQSANRPTTVQDNVIPIAQCVA